MNIECRGQWIRKPLALTVLLFYVTPLPSFSASDSEFKVKAAFIHQFTKYVEWTRQNEEQRKNFSICVIGQHALTKALDDLASAKKVKGNPIIVKDISEDGDLSGTDVLYITVPTAERLHRVLTRLPKDSQVLTISEGKDFAENGVIINFYVEEDKLRFEINLKAAKAAGFTISSQLLKLAKVVESGG